MKAEIRETDALEAFKGCCMTSRPLTRFKWSRKQMECPDNNEGGDLSWVYPAPSGELTRSTPLWSTGRWQLRMIYNDYAAGDQLYNYTAQQICEQVCPDGYTQIEANGEGLTFATADELFGNNNVAHAIQERQNAQGELPSQGLSSLPMEALNGKVLVAHLKAAPHGSLEDQVIICKSPPVKMMVTTPIKAATYGAINLGQPGQLGGRHGLPECPGQVDGNDLGQC